MGGAGRGRGNREEEYGPSPPVRVMSLIPLISLRRRVGGETTGAAE
jgi:hypothetical protein